MTATVPTLFALLVVVLIAAAIFWLVAGAFASLRVAKAARQNERMAATTIARLQRPFVPVSELHTPIGEEEPEKEGA